MTEERGYRVDIRVRIPAVLVAPTLERFDEIFGQVAETPVASLALKAFPAIASESDADGSRLCLSWVGLHAENAWHATTQAGEVLEELVRLLHIPRPRELSVQASPDDGAPDD
jgi:hypothetical protein